MMERQMLQLVRLVDDLLDVSRVSRGKVELRREPIELAAVLRNAIETSQPLLAERHHQFVARIPAEKIVVDADMTRLSQVFWNLLNNAAKYTPNGGRIELEVRLLDGSVAVSVRDNGFGIPPAMQTRIFEIFTQVDRELCVVHPPHFMGPERLPILHWKKSTGSMRETQGIFRALEECGMRMEPILCGGDRRIVQEREQWSSGCNFLALRPGLVVSYSRNEATLREMEKTGFRIVSAHSFLDGSEEIREDERAVITFDGGELVRGGGGARCMTCPTIRDDPWE
jgi:hypothetical protein